MKKYKLLLAESTQSHLKCSKCNHTWWPRRRGQELVKCLENGKFPEHPEFLFLCPNCRCVLSSTQELSESQSLEDKEKGEE